MPGQAVTLNGRTYLVDYGNEAYRRRSIPLLRQQLDSGKDAGAQSISSEGAWRRGAESWHHGNGQTHLDRDVSDPLRFNTSHDVDPWTQYTMSMLPRTIRTITPTTGITTTVVSGAYLFFNDGTALKSISSVTAGPFVNTYTGLYSPAVVPGRLATDGQTVYIPQGSHGLYSVPNNMFAATLLDGTAVDNAYWALGRLMTTRNLDLSNVTGTGSSVVMTLPAGRWVGVTEGSGFIYAAASDQTDPTVAGRGTIYRIGILADGTGLDVPVIAARLPTGEDARSVFGYLGYLLIGTSKGIRFAQENADGSLTLGSLRRVGYVDDNTDPGVQDFTAEDRFVWYTQNGRGLGAGIGRVDLSEFISPLTPAGADDLRIGGVDPNGSSDIIVNSTGRMTSNPLGPLVSYRFFTVAGNGTYGGLWFEDQYKAPAGVWTSGEIDYGLAEGKLPLFVDLQCEPLPGNSSINVAVSVNGGAFNSAGTLSTTGATGLTVALAGSANVVARTFQVQVTLTTGSPQNAGPIVTRVTLRAYPCATRGEDIVLPILLSESTTIDDADSSVDPSAEIAAVRALLSSNVLVPLVEGDITTQVLVEDFEFAPHHPTQDGLDSNGVLLVKMKSFAA